MDLSEPTVVWQYRTRMTRDDSHMCEIAKGVHQIQRVNGFPNKSVTLCVRTMCTLQRLQSRGVAMFPSYRMCTSLQFRGQRNTFLISKVVRGCSWLFSTHWVLVEGKEHVLRTSLTTYDNMGYESVWAIVCQVSLHFVDMSDIESKPN